MQTWKADEGASGRERRSSPRYPVDLPVLFHSELLDERVTLEVTEGRVTDVSHGGVFVCIPAVEPVGAPVRLVVQLPSNGAVVHLDGYVAWIAEGGPRRRGVGVAVPPVLMARLLERIPWPRRVGPVACSRPPGT